MCGHLRDCQQLIVWTVHSHMCTNAHRGSFHSAVPRTQVTFAAYLAVLLGTFFPVVFLITLYIQSESMKAGEDSMFE